MVDAFIQEKLKDPNWRPYCLVCTTMGRMTRTDYGFRCDGLGDLWGRKGCGNTINFDMTHHDPQPPSPSTNMRLDVDLLAARIATAACELDGPADPASDDTISITMKDLEAVVHRHVTVALEETR